MNDEFHAEAEILVTEAVRRAGKHPGPAITDEDLRSWERMDMHDPNDHDGRIEGIGGFNSVPVSDDLDSALSKYLSSGNRLSETESDVLRTRDAIHEALESRWVSVVNALGTQEQYDSMLTDLARAALSKRGHDGDNC